jgi:hypothetical protein
MLHHLDTCFQELQGMLIPFQGIQSLVDVVLQELFLVFNIVTLTGIKQHNGPHYMGSMIDIATDLVRRAPNDHASLMDKKRTLGGLVMVEKALNAYVLANEKGKQAERAASATS